VKLNAGFTTKKSASMNPHQIQRPSRETTAAVCRAIVGNVSGGSFDPGAGQLTRLRSESVTRTGADSHLVYHHGGFAFKINGFSTCNRLASPLLNAVNG